MACFSLRFLTTPYANSKLLPFCLHEVTKITLKYEEIKIKIYKHHHKREMNKHQVSNLSSKGFFDIFLHPAKTENRI